MIINKTCIITGGVLIVADHMVVFHSRFYKLFNWKKDFERITLRNQKIFYTIHIALLLFFLVFTFLSFVYVNELSQCKGLAFSIVISYSLFWLWRAIWQLIYFNPKKSNSSKKLVFLHYFLIIIFLALFVVYFIPVLSKLSL